MLPSFNEIESLHKKYAPSPEAFNLVFTHCKIVSEIAQSLLENKPQRNINSELARIGCLLHDIGVYALFTENGINEEKYITHGIEGYSILKREGYPEEICRFASHHTGTGLSANEIKSDELPLPHEDFFADTPEEQLVMYADKFHSKKPRFNTFESYANNLSRFGAEKVVRFNEFAETFGVPDLKDLSNKYDHPIV